MCTKFVGLLIVLLALVIIGVSFQDDASANGGCDIQGFTLSPVDPYTLGTHVVLHGWSNCGTVRFEITNLTTYETIYKAEIGAGEQYETWKTEETGSGTFDVCFVARGEDGWENANRNCRTVYVEGGQAPLPSGSENTCQVLSFNVTQQGQVFNFASQGQCTSNLRAGRYLLAGQPWGEHSTPVYNASWDSSGAAPGTYQACYQVTGGDWAGAATACTDLNVQAEPPTVPVVIEVQPMIDNPIPAPTGQTISGGATSDGNETGSISSGSLDVDGYCASKGFSGFHTDGYSYYCNGSTMIVSLEYVCRFQYGSGSHAQGQPGNHGSFTCVGGSSDATSSTGLSTSSTGSTSSGGDSASNCSASQLRTGNLAAVDVPSNDPLNLRSSMSVSSSILARLPRGTVISLIGGPDCKEGYQWWETEYNGQRGYVAENDRYGNYFLVPNGTALGTGGSTPAPSQPTGGISGGGDFSPSDGEISTFPKEGIKGPTGETGSGSCTGPTLSPLQVGDEGQVNSGIRPNWKHRLWQS